MQPQLDAFVATGPQIVRSECDARGWRLGPEAEATLLELPEGCVYYVFGIEDGDGVDAGIETVLVARPR